MRLNIMRITRLKTAFIALFAFLTANCSTPSPFVTVSGGQFVRNGRPYSFVGTNFWYGPILASDGEGGDHERLVRELDTMKSLGIEGDYEGIGHCILGYAADGAVKPAAPRKGNYIYRI